MSERSERIELNVRSERVELNVRSTHGGTFSCVPISTATTVHP